MENKNENQQFFALWLNREDYVEFRVNCRNSDQSAAQVIRKLIKEYNKKNRTQLQKMIDLNEKIEQNKN